MAARLSALLDPPPERVTVVGQVNEQPPANYALVPATPVEDSHAAVALGSWTLGGVRTGGIPASDGLRHGGHDGACRQRRGPAEGPTDAPVVAVTTATRGRVVEIAVVDTGRGIAESSDPRVSSCVRSRDVLSMESRASSGTFCNAPRRLVCGFRCRSLPGRAGCSGRRCGTAQPLAGICLAPQSSYASRRSGRSRPFVQLGSERVVR